jgi:hypothetical protein
MLLYHLRCICVLLLMRTEIRVMKFSFLQQLQEHSLSAVPKRSNDAPVVSSVVMYIVIVRDTMDARVIAFEYCPI